MTILSKIHIFSTVTLFEYDTVTLVRHGWLHCTVAEQNFPCLTLDLQLTGDHLCG